MFSDGLQTDAACGWGKKQRRDSNIRGRLKNAAAVRQTTCRMLAIFPPQPNMAAQHSKAFSIMDKLTNHFLIATPALEDPFFAGSVVYICRHDDDGAMGVIINKASPIPMEAVFSAAEKDVPDRFQNQPILMGGPVQIDRGFVVHTPCGAWQSSFPVGGDTALTTSRDIIERLAQNDAVEKAILTIGCSSWSAGQLEQELAQNSWLTVPADDAILFDIPLRKRHRAALSKLGIQPAALMQGAGHA